MPQSRRLPLGVKLQALGLLTMAGATLALGAWLRRHPGRKAAENSSRVLHGVFWVGMVAPSLAVTVSPGLTRLDGALGLPSLPLRRQARVLGAALFALGTFFMVASNRALRALGQGTNAFILTRQVVGQDVYRHTRNPMSLGLYLQSVGLGLALGSTSITGGALLGTIPVHVLFLKYFEERELELRFGESYVEYRERVPFLLPAQRPAVEDREQ